MSKASEEGAKIEYHTDSSEQCMFILEALCEGITQANQVWLHNHPEAPDNLVEGGVVYEDPRPTSNADLDQAIGIAPVLIKRGRATCVEMACFEAARWRQIGIDASVELVPQKGAYGQIIDYSYHAIVRLPDGEVKDPTAELPGYNDQGSWWKNAGHCCVSCAMGRICEDDCPDHDHPKTGERRGRALEEARRHARRAVEAHRNGGRPR